MEESTLRWPTDKERVEKEEVDHPSGWSTVQILSHILSRFLLEDMNFDVNVAFGDHYFPCNQGC